MSATHVPAPIRLRLVRSHGDAVDLVSPVSPEGRGLADALELGGERLNDTQWRSANRCRIVPDGDAWRLVNESHTLVCALNGVRVVASASVTIAAGDVLELGLLRFLVESATQALPAVTAASVVVPQVDPQAMSEAAPNAVADAVEFDLRDLAFPATQAGLQRAPSAGDDPFGVLDIDGAEALPVTDPLAELLGEAPAPQRRRDRRVPTGVDGDATVEGAPLLPDQPSAAMREEALFVGLHEEFVRVARDPAQLAGRTDWEGLLAPGGAPAPSFEDLVLQGEPFPLVRDILEPPESIDRVIDDFDPLGRPTLLDIRVNEDILHLFAPELARKAVTAMPSLTRQEHHHLSPDSHMQLGLARPEGRDAAQPLHRSTTETNPPNP